MEGRGQWGGGALFPLNEAPRRCEQHPPIVAALRDGWEWDGGWTWTSRRRGARRRGGLRRQTGSSCTRAGGQVLSGEGWIKQINT